MNFMLSRAEAAQVCVITEECCEMWDDPAAWQRHAADRVEHLTGSVGAMFTLNDLHADAHRVVELHSSTTYLESGSLLEAVQAAPSTGVMPGYVQGLRQMRARGLGAITAAELSTLREYHASEFYQTHLAPRRVDEVLLIEAVAAHAGLDVQLAVARETNARAFSLRERHFLCAVAESIAARVELKLCTGRQRGLHWLSPRQREVLAGLLEGHSEKQIAAQLQISGPTVHEHVTLLYRYFAVHSRGELLAYFVRRRPSTLQP
jgi:DNA-binding CsgD family transcriptional regulator